MISALDSISWHSFLHRQPLAAAPPVAIATLARHPILITGAGGSIGSALAQRLRGGSAQLTLLESSENSLFDLESDLVNSVPCHSAEFYLGSVADSGLLEEIFARYHPQLVFHAAAHKHVPLLEEQPLAAIDNNVFGTRTLVSYATKHGARVILLSTDKAVAPVSVMGATKRVAEQIVLAAGGAVVRLGNVLGSRGSVAEVFASQIAAGIPLTVTDPGARRYFMTVSEAVDLLISAAAEPNPSALFIPDLHSTHYIADLARFMARTLAPDRNVPIEFTHLRAGDKETEAFSSPQEIPHETRANGLIRIDSLILPAARLHDLLENLKVAVQSRELTRSLSVLRQLVPDYAPSRAVEALRDTAEPPVHNA